MRVLLTTPYDLAVPGGVNRHALDLLEALTRRGVEARLVGPASDTKEGARGTPSPPRGGREVEAERPRLPGFDPGPSGPDDPRIVRLGRVWVGSLNGARSRVTLEVGLGGAMRRLIAEFRPDVVHLQEPFLPTLNTFALWHAGGARRVGTFHTYAGTSRGYLWAWPWCRWINRRLDARLAVSEAAREFATRYHPAEFQVVPNGVWLPPAAGRRALRPPGRPARVLFVGRGDEPRKGLAILRAAMRGLETDAPGKYACEAVGPATPRGAVSQAELAAAYAAADVCVVPSLGGESFGLVALEALAHGVPVIASHIRGYAEWLEGAEVGELVPPGDPRALAAALARLLGDPERHRRSAAAALALAARYEWAALAERIVTTAYGVRS